MTASGQATDHETEALARARATTLRYRTAAESYDLEAMLSTLAPGVIFHSPLTARVRFEGPEQVGALLRAAMPAMTAYRFQRDLGDEHTRVLVATATVKGHDLQETMLLELDDEARITEITMWMRPLPAITAAMLAIGPGLARLGGRPILAVLAAAAIRPLAFLTRFGDRTLVPLIADSRRAGTP
ncbi:nuclear transport factor 2 family protein [Streptosporangium sp. KLBMP 9127]|nr:nuclear transport factor 2 family protein [Streptosporangium sp. KLBMP 9127]